MISPTDVEGLDLIIIALTPTATPDIVRSAISLGIPCLVEKPLSLNLEQISQIRELANRKSLPIAVNLQARFVPEMHVLRSLVKQEKYGRLREIEVRILGNTGGYAAPIPYSWLHDAALGGGVLGISGPHASEFAHSLAAQGRLVFRKTWQEVSQRKDTAGEMRECTAEDNALVVCEHEGMTLSTLRLGTTSRKAEETWSARCDDGTLRYGADKKLSLVDNLGKTIDVPSSRTQVLEAHSLADKSGLMQCSDKAFPSLVLLNLFAKRLKGKNVSRNQRLESQCND